MRERVGDGRSRLAAVDWRRLSRRSALTGFWLLRFCLGIVLVVYALSFVGPAPVDGVEIGYTSPDRVAHDVVANLRTETYRMTLEANRTNEAGDAERLVERMLTIDNSAHLYATRSRTGDAIENSSIGAHRLYGTYTTGYERPRAGGTGPAGDAETPSWERDDDHRYHPSRNAFESIDSLNGTGATVVTESAAEYVVRIDDRETATDVVEIPGHSPSDEDDWNATLTLTVARDTDRLTEAEYRYRVPATGERVQATYRFHYGRLADVDRPLATYPPGGELVTRLDLGLRAVEDRLGGVDP